MKTVICLQTTPTVTKDTVMRVSNDVAARMVNSKKWRYCPKRLFKEKLKKNTEQKEKIAEEIDSIPLLKKEVVTEPVTEVV